MTKVFERNSIHRHPLIVWSRIKIRWPVLVWVVAIVAAVYLYFHGVESAPVTGFVQTFEQLVAPVEPCRIAAVLVTPGQAVTNGQPLAQMDAASIDAELRVQRELGLQAIDTILGYQDNVLQMQRQFAATISALESTLATEKRLVAEAKAELEVLNEEVKRLEKLVEMRALDASTLSLLKARQAMLRQSVECYPSSIASLERRLKEARSDSERLDAWHRLRDRNNPASSAVIAERVKQQERINEEQLALLEARRNLYMLRACRDGIVSRVFKLPGSTLVANEVVVSVVSPDSDHVFGFLSESRARSFQTGMSAWVYSGAGPQKRIPAVVESVSPDVSALPMRMTPLTGQGGAAASTQVLRSRRVALRLTAPHNLIPGESVLISPAGKWRVFSREWFRERGRQFLDRLEDSRQ